MKHNNRWTLPPALLLEISRSIAAGKNLCLQGEAISAATAIHPARNCFPTGVSHRRVVTGVRIPVRYPVAIRNQKAIQYPSAIGKPSGSQKANQ
jgi:hypothetical protein